MRRSNAEAMTQIGKVTLLISINKSESEQLMNAAIDRYMKKRAAKKPIGADRARLLRMN